MSLSKIMFQSMLERITYLDSAKGICMLMIVCDHVGANVPIPLFHTAQTAAFFLLSGYFFSVNSAVSDFMKKSIKRILLPFVFFYVVSYVLFYTSLFVVPGFKDMTEASGIMDCFTQKQYFNGPLWFLLALLWIRIVVYFLVKYVKYPTAQLVIALGCGGVGFALNYYHVDLPLALDTAASSVPLYYLGFYVKCKGFLNNYSKTESIFFAVVFYISCLYIPIAIANSINRYSGNYAEYLYVAFVLSLAIVLLSKGCLYRKNIISFIGENSMWLLCSHHLIYRPVKLLVDKIPITNMIESYNSYIVLLITVAICCLSVPIVNKYIPWAIGVVKNKE